MASVLLVPGNSAGAAKASVTTEQFTGADCSVTGDLINRVLTTAAITSASGDIDVIVDRQILRETTDYTVSGLDITFLGRIRDSQKIDIKYLI